MRHIKPYGDNSQSFGITRTLNYDDLIMNESAILSRIESLIPENVRFELEIKLLLEQGFRIYYLNKYLICSHQSRWMKSLRLINQL